MKRIIRPIILVTFLLTLTICSSWADETVKNGNYRGIGYFINSDTAIVNQYIKVAPFDVSILPPSSGVQYYKDGIIFLSSSKSNAKMPDSHISFGTIDTRYAVLRDSVLEAPGLFSPSFSFPYPSEAVTFSMDYKTMYFTNYSKADGCEKIYRAEYSDGDPAQWLPDSDPVSFCSGNSTCTHPALSADGKVMVFASDRQSSVGGMDLYVSLFKDNRWSEPENIGDAVNSSFNELYPYLDSENNLYFSSDNTQGFGGYDVYVCKFKNNTWEKPINLSTPVNTRFDDVAFRVNRKDEKSAFYTVKQNSGKSYIQLFKVSINNNTQSDQLTLSQYYTRPDISNMVILALEPAVQATDAISETAARPEGSTDRGNLVYRVQFLTSFNPKTRSQIVLNGQEYSVFEYLYSGAYRLCIGEFSTLSPALELQGIMIKNDYPNASVLVFRDNVLSLEPELLKSPSGQTPETAVAQPPASKTTVAEPEPSGKDTESIAAEPPSPEALAPEPPPPAIPATAVAKEEPVEEIKPAPEEQKDIVVYRVQLFSSSKKAGSKKITVANKPYMTFEYLYKGAYRSCIGEFDTLAQAVELQNISRKNGHPQAFVVAFIDDVRSTDPALFK
jgi:hypothetical protein